MNAPRVLRPYQVEAVNAVLDHWGRDIRNVAVVMPTGSGKSSTIAGVADKAAQLGLRVVLIAHRAELLDQMARTVEDLNPRYKVGIVRAQQRESDRQIVAASVQTLLHESRRVDLGRRDVILYDECHHIGSDKWTAVVRDLQASSPMSFFCGFTATLSRADGKALREVIEAVAYEKSLRWAIDEGHLVKPHGLTVKLDNLALQSVRTRAGDFALGELAEVMEAETDSVVKAIMDHAKDRRMIVFAASVKASRDIAMFLNAESGMVAEAVNGGTDYAARQAIYDRFRSGVTDALVTVQVLTEGADFPMCDCVVIARPTQSHNLLSQMVGRALRTHPGKTDALVLDLVGTTRVMKLATLTDLDGDLDRKVVDSEGVESADPEDDPSTASRPRERMKRRGALELTQVDLMDEESEDPILWLKTPGGVRFVCSKTTDHVCFMVTDDDGHITAGVTQWSAPRGAKYDYVAEGTDLKQVARATEQLVESHEVMLPRKNAAWRKRSAPSDAQVEYGRSLGIEEPETMTRARLSDEISIARVSHHFGWK